MNTKFSVKLIATFFIFFFIIPHFSLLANAESKISDLDVIFVFDVSTSMQTSDSDRLAITAVKLFLDKCRRTTDSRAGYVMYSHRIVEDSQSLRNGTINESIDILKSKINQIQYNDNEGTDIALGLERAEALLREGGSLSEGGRKPVIILLSDGKTDLETKNKNGISFYQSGVSRSNAASEKALEKMINLFEEHNVPVFTIGLNVDGTVDMDVMKKIAGERAFAREVKKSDELPGILSEIFAHLFNGIPIPFPQIIATGEPQSAEISISNDSIYEASITVFSNNPLRDIALRDSDGNNRIDGEDVNVCLDQNYTLIKISKPKKGKWFFNFTGTKGDTISINLLALYDLNLIMDMQRTTDDQQFTFTAHLEDVNMKRIDDKNLFDSTTLTLHTRNTETEENFEFEFERGKTSVSYSLSDFRQKNMSPGEYESFIVMEGEGICRVSNTCMFYISPESISLRTDNKKISLWSHFFFTQSSFSLDEIISYKEYNLPLRVSFEGMNGESVGEISYDEVNVTINAMALNSGKAEIIACVSDSYGNKVKFDIILNIFASWILAVILAAMLIIAWVVVWRITHQIMQRGIVEFKVIDSDGNEWNTNKISLSNRRNGLRISSLRIFDNYDVFSTDPDKFNKSDMKLFEKELRKIRLGRIVKAEGRSERGCLKLKKSILSPATLSTSEILSGRSAYIELDQMRRVTIKFKDVSDEPF